ncbi:hypothetical protein BJX68DRAFT_245592 [Aspergillus pseudodeflectus]|uniref:Uncharacterized protein n=1 Tax=Aspergillus pseudodeflectus TaxID=176178 RepID=A0ABR4JNB7_9EURO
MHPAAARVAVLFHFIPYHRRCKCKCMQYPISAHMQSTSGFEIVCRRVMQATFNFEHADSGADPPCSRNRVSNPSTPAESRFVCCRTRKNPIIFIPLPIFIYSIFFLLCHNGIPIPVSFVSVCRCALPRA